MYDAKYSPLVPKLCKFVMCNLKILHVFVLVLSFLTKNCNALN